MSFIISLRLFYETYVEENTMNLSEDLSVDKELFSGVYEGKYNSFLYISVYKINFLIKKIYSFTIYE